MTRENTHKQSYTCSCLYPLSLSYRHLRITFVFFQKINTLDLSTAEQLGGRVKAGLYRSPGENSNTMHSRGREIAFQTENTVIKSNKKIETRGVLVLQRMTNVAAI